MSKINKMQNYIILIIQFKYMQNNAIIYKYYGNIANNYMK